MILGRQIRAARALAGLSQDELAATSGCGVATVRRLEASADDVGGTAQTIARIQRALEAAEIVFIEQDDKHGPGVRLKVPLR